MRAPRKSSQKHDLGQASARLPRLPELVWARSTPQGPRSRQTKRSKPAGDTEPAEDTRAGGDRCPKEVATPAEAGAASQVIAVQCRFEKMSSVLAAGWLMAATVQDAASQPRQDFSPSGFCQARACGFDGASQDRLSSGQKSSSDCSEEPRKTRPSAPTCLGAGWAAVGR